MIAPRQDFSVEINLGLIPHSLSFTLNRGSCHLVLIMSHGLNLASEVWVPNSKYLINFIQVDFGWWVTILGMVGYHPWDVKDTSSPESMFWALFESCHYCIKTIRHKLRVSFQKIDA